MTEFPVTDRTRLRRQPERASYDRDTAYAILDEALICHVGFVTSAGPVVIPTIHARRSDTLYLHGSPASRMLRSLKTGIPVCVAVTLLDGLVLARSVFEHSMNYRSVVVFGTATEVTGGEHKLAAMRALTEHVVPGRWDDARQPSPKEIKATTMLAVPLEEASIKTRTGPPVDEDEDYDLAVWAGVLPISSRFEAPVPDPRLGAGIPLPGYLAGYRR